MPLRGNYATPVGVTDRDRVRFLDSRPDSPLVGLFAQQLDHAERGALGILQDGEAAHVG